MKTNPRQSTWNVIGMVLLPFLAFLGFAALFVRQNLHDIDRSARVIERLMLVEDLSNVIGMLQRERGKTALVGVRLVGSDDLVAAWQATDASWDQLAANVAGADLPASITGAIAHMRTTLPALRERGHTASAAAADFRDYTAIISLLFDTQQMSMADVARDGVEQTHTNLLLLASVRESVGRLRARLSHLLATDGTLNEAELEIALGAHAGIEVILEHRALDLPDEIERTFAQKRQGRHWTFVNESLHKVLQHSDTGGFGVDARLFFEAVSSVIDDIDQAIRLEIGTVRARQNELRVDSRRRLIRSLFLVMLVTVPLVVLVVDDLRSRRERARAEARLVVALDDLREAREQEARIGFEIQRALLLGPPPCALDGFVVAAMTTPSMGVDGDFYDFVVWNPHSFDVLFGDVMGKGVPAALVGAATKSHFQRVIAQALAHRTTGDLPAPVDIVSAVHAAMTVPLSQVERFVSLHYGRFDRVARTLTLVNCGHTVVLCFRGLAATCLRIAEGDMPIGIHADAHYHQSEHSIEEGDLWLFLSDGITDARNDQRQFFGYDRLIEVVQQCLVTGTNPETLLQTVLATVRTFCGSNDFSDDFSCIAVRVGAAPGSGPTN